MTTLHVVGDSISIQYGPYLGTYLSPWCEYSRKGDDPDIPIPEGANGQDSAIVLRYVKRCVKAGKRWDIVVINCGLWDVRDRGGQLQTDLAGYVANLTSVADLVPQISNRFMWVRTTPIVDELHNSTKTDYQRHNADVVRYNEAADTLVRERGGELIDLYGFCLAMGMSHATRDGVHFRDELAPILGAFVAGQIAARLDAG